MKFMQKSKLELGDTLVPDLFILNNMKSLKGTEIKIYLCIIYLLKQETEIDSDIIQKELNITSEELKSSIEVLIAEGLLTKNSKGYMIVDLKEAEINKSFAPKFENKPKRQQPGVDERRKACVDAISESFFNGIMTLSWYTDIGNLFNIYTFSEEVMIALFQYCKERNALNRKYVFAVAETWNNGGVKTFEDLEAFLDNYDKFTKIKTKIAKALGFGRNLTKFEEVYVKKWLDEYNYSYEVIEEGLKRSTSTANPSIKYIDAIISSWYKKGFKSVEDILDAEKPIETIEKTNVKITETKKKSFQSYSQREYDTTDDFYDEI